MDRLNASYSSSRVSEGSSYDRIDSSDYEEKEAIFNVFAGHQNGKIRLGEMGEVFRALGLNPTNEDIAACKREIVTKNGSVQNLKEAEKTLMVTFDEFLPLFQILEKKDQRNDLKPDDFVQAFSHFDPDGNGLVSKGAMRRILTTMGEPMSDEDVDEILAAQEEVAPGMINYATFVEAVYKEAHGIP